MIPRRENARFPSMLSLAVCIPALVAMGCDGPVAPEGEPGVQASNAPVITETVPISELAGSGISGSAELTRSKDGLGVDMDVDGLVAGDTYTIWWAVFDNPPGCDADGCNASDFDNPSARATLVNGGGFVAGSGTNSVGSELDRHDVGGRQVVFGDPNGVDNPYRAEAHLVLRSHGLAEVDAANLAQQTSTIGAFCNLPVVGCQNQSAAVFVPTGAPGQR